MHRVNTVFAGLVLIAVGLAFIPLASNRPAFWAIWGVIFGLLGCAYAVWVLILGAVRRPAGHSLLGELLTFLMLLAYIAFQTLPVLQGVPLDVVTHTGAIIRSESISLDPGSSLLVLLQLATYALVFVLVFQVAINRRRARWMLWTLFCLSAVASAYALVSLTQLGDTLLGLPKEAYLGSATGTFTNRNSFATFLAMGAALGMALLFEQVFENMNLRDRIVRAGLVLLLLACIIAGLYATQSRMGTMAGLVGCIVVTLVYAWSFRSKFKNVGLAIALVVGLALLGTGAIGLLLVFGEGVTERLIFQSVGTDARIELYRSVLDAISRRIWVGYGAGSFASVFPAFQDQGLAGQVIWSKAHSTYLALWFELGVIAGSIPLLIVASILLRAGFALPNQSNRVISAGTIGVVFVMGCHSLVDFSAEIYANAVYFTVVLALAAAGSRAIDPGEVQ